MNTKLFLFTLLLAAPAISNAAQETTPKKTSLTQEQVAEIRTILWNARQWTTNCVEEENDLVEFISKKTDSLPPYILHYLINSKAPESLIRTTMQTQEVYDEKALIHLAVKYGYKQIVDDLAQNEATLEAKNSLGRTALNVAFDLKNIEIMQILLSYGAKEINHENKFQEDPRTILLLAYDISGTYVISRSGRNQANRIKLQRMAFAVEVAINSKQHLPGEKTIALETLHNCIVPKEITFPYNQPPTLLESSCLSVFKKDAYRNQMAQALTQSLVPSSAVQ